MRKFLLFTILLSLVSSFAVADPVVEAHGANFPTASRKVVVVATQGDYKIQIEQLLALHGAQIEQGFFAKLFLPNVSFKSVPNINGSNRALSIRVTKNSVKVLYTSDEMGERALKLFESLFENPYGQRIIRGKDILEILPAEKSLPSSRSAITDGVTNLLTVPQVQSAIRHSPNSDFIMAVVSKRIFRFNFDVFGGSTAANIATSGAYSPTQIAQFVKSASDAGKRFVPAVDLISPNPIFEAYTGHSMNSVEGMRFVRAMIEQCARVWKVKAICIGRKSTVIDGRYSAFLADIAAREGVDLIVI